MDMFQLYKVCLMQMYNCDYETYMSHAYIFIPSLHIVISFHTSFHCRPMVYFYANIFCCLTDLNSVFKKGTCTCTLNDLIFTSGK